MLTCKFPPCCDAGTRCRGMALAELVVVLVILAALAAIAVEALAPRAEQARFEATQRTLESVRTAILNVDTSATNTAVTGFIADNGRPPLTLQELVWSPTELAAAQQSGLSQDLSLFGLQPAPPPHGDVLVPRGFRGPYLRAPVGGTALVDGWGVPLVFLNPDPLTSGLAVVSPAATRPASATGQQVDLAVRIAPTDCQAALLAGKVYVHCNYTGPTRPTLGDVTLYLFGPGQNGAANVVHGVRVHAFQIPAAAFTSTDNGQAAGMAAFAANYAIANGAADGNGLPVFLWAGPVALRFVGEASLTSGGSSGLSSGAPGPTTTAASFMSQPNYVTVRPGATQLLDLHVDLKL